MRFLAPLLCLSLSVLSGCASTSEEMVDVTPPSDTSPSSPVTPTFQAAAFGDPWSLASGWESGTAGGAAYLAGGPRHLLHNNDISLTPPVIGGETYSADYQAWYAYCSGDMTRDDPRLRQVVSSMIPYPFQRDCFVLP